MSSYPVWALIVGSIVSSVALVLVNKEIFREGFTFVLTLSTFHFIATYLLLQIMASSLALFETKYLPTKENIIMGGFGVASIVFMNYSLKWNTVGFYQVMKLSVIPVVLLIDYVTKGKLVSRKVTTSLVLVLAGVAVATVTDVELRQLGLVMGVLAVLSTAQYQLWQGSKQAQFQLSGTQCAHSVALVQTAWAGVFAALLEFSSINQQFPSYSVPLPLLGKILLSCLLAVSVNVHTFLLIGKTSAVTFQVVGHGKTILILLGGYLLFPLADTHLLFQNLTGILLALVGVTLYGNLQLTEKSGSPDWLDQFLPSSMLAFLLPPPTPQQLPV